MRSRFQGVAALAFGLLGLASASLAAPIQGPLKVEVPGGAKNTPPVIDARLYRPVGSGPFPAVVAMHGCSGLWSTKDKTALSPRHAEWGEALAALGYVVIFPDSYGSRGLGSQCANGDRSVEPFRERPADAAATRAYLQGLPFVRPDAIVLLGWSNGGSTVLYEVRPQDKAKDGKPDFRGAIAFYPGCRDPFGGGKWQTRMPLMVLIGEADDWTPAAPCKDIAAAGGAQVKLTLYPGAYHDFDNAEQPVHEVKGVAFSATGTGTVHTGFNPAARADALKRVPAFLAEVLK